MILLLVISVLGMISSSVAFKDGAPESACSSLLPIHQNNSPQQGQSPYTVTAVRIGKKLVNVTITSPSGEEFRGFILQPRSAQDNSKIIYGTFETSTETKGVNCSHDLMSTTLTHKNRKPKSNVTTVWEASHVNEDIIFRATVVKTYTEFWEKIDSEPVKMKTDGEIPSDGKSHSKAIFDGCLTTKGCVGIPEHCIDVLNCEVLLTYEDYMDGTIRFDLHGQLNSSEYMALGFSDDNIMGNDSVIECFHTGGTEVKLRRSWNEGKSNTRTTDETRPYDFEYIDGITSCGWSEPNITSYFGHTYNLYDGSVYILLAKGPMENGRVRYHSSKFASNGPNDFFFHGVDSTEKIRPETTEVNEGPIEGQGTASTTSTPEENMDARSCCSLLKLSSYWFAFVLAFYAGRNVLECMD